MRTTLESRIAISEHVIINNKSTHFMIYKQEAKNQMCRLFRKALNWEHARAYYYTW